MEGQRKKFSTLETLMKHTMVFLLYGLVQCAQSITPIRELLGHSEKIAGDFLFLGLCVAIPMLSFLILILVIYKWIKDEKMIDLKILKTGQILIKLLTAGTFWILVLEFCSLAGLTTQGGTQVMFKDLGHLIFQTILTLIMWTVYHSSMTSVLMTYQEMMVTQEQVLQEDIEQIHIVSSGQQDVLPAYHDLFPEEDDPTLPSYKVVSEDKM